MSISATKRHWKKAPWAPFFNGFSTSKCKRAAKLVVAKIELLRSEQQVVAMKKRRHIAFLLKSGQEATARVKVEPVMREQNILEAEQFIELYCGLIMYRLSTIAKQRECPAELEEGISTLIFAAATCPEIPELVALRNIFEKKYGKDFVEAATDLQPDCGVNRRIVDMLTITTPAGENVKMKVLMEIANEYQIEWDTTESETELLKPAEKLIDGPQIGKDKRKVD